MTTTTAIQSGAPHEAAHPRMQTYRYEVRFLTPAFLGDAEQSGCWRTPPFKAQLRQWWRVVYAADAGFKPSLEAMRCEEGLLFGNAWLKDSFSKSLIRLRLDRWQEGKETKQSWGRQELDKATEGVRHPEVGVIGPKLYLGYGPLMVEKVDGHRKPTQYATVLKHNAAIQAGESAVLSLAVPAQHAARIEQALALMHRYGTVGGRSRNGWGSYALNPCEGTPELQGASPVRDWRQCLELDWPHAIGKDDKGPLIWQTAPHADWKALMRTLAILKIGLRTQFALKLDTAAGDVQKKRGIEHGQAQARHWLAYPVTNHWVRPWGGSARLPNQLRFKVRALPNGQLVGIIFHMPHLPPPAFHPNRTAVERVWQQVHAFLDAPAQKLFRIQGPKP